MMGGAARPSFPVAGLGAISLPELALTLCRLREAMRAANAEMPCGISKPVLEQASQSSRALNCPRCISRRPVAWPTLDFPGSAKNCHSTNYLPQKVFSALFPGSFSSPVIGSSSNTVEAAEAAATTDDYKQ